MLIDFKFKNFLSYKDEARLLMTPVKSFKELSKFNLMHLENDMALLKSSAIYGSNGGGKSNLIEAIAFMRDRIFNSFSESLKKEEDKRTTDYYFKLSTETERTPSVFETTFIAHNKIIYRYGFEIKGFEIISEWLFKKVEVETPLFTRKLQKIKINKTGFKEGEAFKKTTNKNILFLSQLAQFNSPESTIVYTWFKHVNIISGLDNFQFSAVTTSLLKESPKFNRWLNLAVKFLEITNLKTRENKNEIVSYHNKYDSNKIIVDSVGFNILDEESDGTCKLIYLLGAIYDTLHYGKTLFVDELNSKLHPNLTVKLMELFHRMNKRGAQFIFTIHDPILLDKEIMRRDQIWFVDRNKYGESELYSMSEFDSSVVRNTSDYRKKYLESTFGAAESIIFTDELTSLLYE